MGPNRYMIAKVGSFLDAAVDTLTNLNLAPKLIFIITWPYLVVLA